jgi:hypothetical protein
MQISPIHVGFGLYDYRSIPALQLYPLHQAVLAEEQLA